MMSHCKTKGTAYRAPNPSPSCPSVPVLQGTCSAAPPSKVCRPGDAESVAVPGHPPIALHITVSTAAPGVMVSMTVLVPITTSEAPLATLMGTPLTVTGAPPAVTVVEPSTMPVVISVVVLRNVEG